MRRDKAPLRFARPSTRHNSGPALKADPVTRRPAWGIVTPRSPATSGNSPMMTNSVVPMPNEARARANKGRRLAEAGGLGARGMIALQHDDRVRLDGLMKRHTSIYAVCF